MSAEQHAATRIETRARRLLRAYPPWERGERGEEIVSTVLDAVARDGGRFAWRDQLDLVLGGLRARHRSGPSLVERFSYWSAEPDNTSGGLAAQFHPWMLHDLARPGWRRRRALALNGPIVALVLAIVGTSKSSGWGGPGLSAAPLAVSAGMIMVRRARSAPAHRWRSVVLERNGYVDVGGPPHAVTVEWSARPPRLSNIGVAFLAGGAALGMAGATVNLVVSPASADAGRALAPTVVLLAVVVPALAGCLCRITRVRPTPNPPATSARVTAGPVAAVVAVGVGVASSTILSIGLPAAAASWAAATLCALLVAALVLTARRQRILRRRIGLWEVYPSTGPRAVRRYCPSAPAS